MGGLTWQEVFFLIKSPTVNPDSLPSIIRSVTAGLALIERYMMSQIISSFIQGAEKSCSALARMLPNCFVNYLSLRNKI
jgi:hypothetical protein